MSSESETKNRLTIIIPTVNNIKGMEYLKNYFKNKEYQIIVVDNGLDSRLRGNDTGKLFYFHQKKNLGFAGGVNKGAEGVKTKWMLILNDDIEFKVKSEKLRVKNYNSKLKNESEETIQRLINFAEENNLDAVSPILRNPNGEVENFGYYLLPMGKIELVKEIPKSKFQETNKSKNPNFKQKILNTKYKILDTDIDGLTAACLLVKTEVFKKLGGFDESFFAYLEDVDFFLRFKKVGYKMGIADIEVLHNHMTTTKTMGNFKARQDMINWWRLFFKHPDKFKFNIQFLIERLRNISGYIKASL